MPKKNKTILKIFLVTLIFLVLDWIIHVLGILPRLAELPSYYFIFKFFLLIPFLFILTKFFNFKINKIEDIWIISIVSALVLQIRYMFFLNLYDLGINVLMIFFHFLMILGAFFLIKSKIFRKTFKLK